MHMLQQQGQYSNKKYRQVNALIWFVKVSTEMWNSKRLLFSTDLFRVEAMHGLEVVGALGDIIKRVQQ